MITKIRLISQITVFFLLIFIAVVTHYENQKGKYGGEAVIQDSVVLRVIDRVIGRWENRSRYLQIVQGDVWAAEVVGIKITDPLAFAGNISRTKKFYGPLFLSCLIPTVLTFLLGKIFCSWICPMGFLSEINDKGRRFFVKMGNPLVEIKIPHWIKYIVLGVGLFGGFFFGVHYFFIIYPPKLISGEIYFGVTRSALSFGMIILFFILVVEFFLAPRLWCRSLCPGGALYTILSRWRVLRIRNDLTRCTDCGICDCVCPYEIKPSQGNLSADCDHCAICITKCPDKTLSFSVGRKK